MSHRNFGPNDVFVNRVKAHPEWDFFIYNSEVFINNNQNISGTLSDTYKGIPPGFLSLYEYNLNRPSPTGSSIYPFLIANTDYKTRFRKDLLNLTGESKDGVVFNFTSGDIIHSEYRMSASITRKYLATSPITINGPFGTHIISNHNATSSVLKNMARCYQTINPHFSTIGPEFTLDKIFSDDVNMINIPSVFYGSEIKKGTIHLNYYVTGTLIASAKDENHNGQLICTFGPPIVSGSTIGYALYREGVLFFNKSGKAAAVLDSGNGILYDGSVDNAKWIYFGAGANDSTPQDQTIASASFSMKFEGTTYKNTMTAMCNADKKELNYSNNPTFLNIDHSASIVNYTTGSFLYSDGETELENIASSSFHKGEDEFRKVTYISKVGIYDEDNNLLMTVDLARPYKKEEKDNFTFKIKYDLL